MDVFMDASLHGLPRRLEARGAIFSAPGGGQAAHFRYTVGSPENAYESPHRT
jgi:hypothetical protein